MIKTIIKKDLYKDSVTLMILNNKINDLESVNIASIMMASPANKEMFDSNGLLTKEVKEATANDVAIVLDLKEDENLGQIIKIIEDELESTSNENISKEKNADTLDEAFEMMDDANMALISIPGTYAYSIGNKCLDKGLNLMLFSDNVDISEEKKLKEKAKKKGLLVMGPDCGTSIINGIALAFANKVKKGEIGIVGASGTGIQEVVSVLDQNGYGISQAIGTGGRDLHSEIEATTFLQSLDALMNDDNTKVIIALSKPPAKDVKEKVERYLHNSKKPVAAIFMGENMQNHYKNLYWADTLEEVAKLAINLLNKQAPIKMEDEFEVKEKKGTIKGLFCGGTLATESANLIKKVLNFNDLDKKDGYILKKDGFEVIDLGDDKYTKGKPHPMIDPTARIPFIKKAAEDENTKIILLDVILGYGSHDDPASTLVDIIKNSSNEKLEFVISLCATNEDYQNVDDQKKKLEEAGAKVFRTNRKATEYALAQVGYKVSYKQKEVLDRRTTKEVSKSEPRVDIFDKKLKIINIGLPSFKENLENFDCEVIQYNFRPIAGGNKELIDALAYLDSIEKIKVSNKSVVDRIIKSKPVLKRVKLAKELIPELKEKVLLHAGPPIKYENMTEPMQGSCVGAILFEGWAKNEKEAFRMLENGEIKFIPCHDVKAVGPMGGITSMNMPMFVVEDEINKTVGYCIMNEGIGKVLRFGAYDNEVITRLHWMTDVLGPTLDKALLKLEGIGVNPMIAQAIAMGDEFHQRNIAATLVFLKHVAPAISSLDISEKDKTDVLQFLADADQFFLNIAMATGKAVMDGARKITEGTIVTAMCRNGENFGIKIAGMGDRWFTAPVNTPKGLYFTGFSEKDANKDIGDSAITETFGIGAMTTIAAPAVTRFVGAGGFDDALETSNRMQKIVTTNNPNFIIPTWNFKGCPLGIDAMKVVELGIAPVINTGIANKKAGLGQIGAGTVNAPLKCFEKAILAYAQKLRDN
ncbi:MAG: acyl-CoA synthetase FdrA [Tissierellia bacterium]|nr:acyl-CoA synthetase FdrA [Tissierellia bacterium]